MIRTVLGDVSAAELGVCDAHDHLFFRSAQLAGQELDDVDAAVAELRAFAALGGQAVVQWTPFGLGRRADLLAGVSRAGGVAVIAATGLHQAAHYHDQAMVRDALPRLAELFTEELTTGMQRQVAESGAFLAFDGPSRANHATDWRLHECLAELVRHGHEDQILIGGDTTTAAARSSTGGGPGLPYLLRVLRPRLAAELGEEVAAKFFTANPARAFSWA